MAELLAPSESDDATALLTELRSLIKSAQTRAARSVNRELVLLYWDMGKRIRADVLDGQERANYGKQILSTVSRELTMAYGGGYSDKNLLRMMGVADAFPDRVMVEKLTETLSWSHFVEILPLRSPLEREFYATMCHASQWSVRGFRKEISGALFTRTALSKNTDELVRQELGGLRDEDKWTPDLALRDPYLLPFLGLADTFSEKDLEDAILREIESFLLEMGTGFAFVARQKRIVVDGRDFTMDLLLYHRKLRRLVVIELKVGPFEQGHKGQLELYLRWLDRYEREKHEEAPIGIILCSEAGPEQVELLQIGKDDIHVAEYITQHLPTPLLQQKLREAERRGRAQIAAREVASDDGEY